MRANQAHHRAEDAHVRGQMAVNHLHSHHRDHHGHPGHHGHHGHHGHRPHVRTITYRT